MKFTTNGRIELKATELRESADDRKSESQISTISASKSTPSKPSSNIVGISNNVPGSTISNKEKFKASSPKIKFLIEVNDTGRGIAPEFLNHMYQPFTQVKFETMLIFLLDNTILMIYNHNNNITIQEDSSLTRRFEGTGLGLSIVKGISLSLLNVNIYIKVFF